MFLALHDGTLQSVSTNQRIRITISQTLLIESQLYWCGVGLPNFTAF